MPALLDALQHSITAMYVNTLRWRRKQEDEEQQPITPYIPILVVSQKCLYKVCLVGVAANLCDLCSPLSKLQTCLCLRFPCDEQFHHSNYRMLIPMYLPDFEARFYLVEMCPSNSPVHSTGKEALVALVKNLNLLSLDSGVQNRCRHHWFCYH